MKNYLFLLVGTIFLKNSSFCFEIKYGINEVPWLHFAENISFPVGGQGVLVAPEWILTAPKFKDIKLVIIEDQSYSIIDTIVYKDICLLKLNKPANHNVLNRLHDDYVTEQYFTLFDNLDHKFHLSKPIIAGTFRVAKQKNNKLYFTQSSLNTINLNTDDIGKGLFIHSNQGLSLCGSVKSDTEAILIDTYNSWLDYTILNSALENKTSSSPQPKHSRSTNNNSQNSMLSQFSGNGTWKYGYLLSPNTFIAPNQPEWQLSSEVLIKNERRTITNITPVNNILLLTLDKSVAKLNHGLSFSLNLSERSEIKINHSNLVRLYIPRNSNVNQQTTVPIVYQNKLSGFSKLSLDNETKAIANHYSLTQALNDVSTANPPTTNPWTFMVYASDDDITNHYTSIYNTLNALFNAVDDAPSNQINIVLQTKIPDNTYKYVQARNNLVAYLEQVVHPKVNQAIKTVSGLVRFLIKKNNNQVTILTQQCGQFNDSLNELQTRKNFLNYVNSLNLPGRKMYCLYAHGKGWHQVGSDGYPVNTVDFVEGIKYQPLNILRLDSCRSQMIETLYEIAIKNPQIPYMVASQQITALDSAIDTYARLIPVAYKSQNVFDYVKQNAQDKTERDMNNAYTRPDLDNVNNGDGLAYSSIDLRLIPELKRRIDILAQNLLNYSVESVANKNMVVNILKKARQEGTLFYGKSTIDSMENRNSPMFVADYDFFFDLFYTVKVFAKEIKSKINDPWKSTLLNACNTVKNMRSIVVLENHISLHPFLKNAKGLSIDLSPAAKFNIKDGFHNFDDEYKELAFSRSGNDLSPWYRLLRLE